MRLRAEWLVEVKLTGVDVLILLISHHQIITISIKKDNTIALLLFLILPRVSFNLVVGVSFLVQSYLETFEKLMF